MQKNPQTVFSEDLKDFLQHTWTSALFRKGHPYLDLLISNIKIPLWFETGSYESGSSWTGKIVLEYKGNVDPVYHDLRILRELWKIAAFQHKIKQNVVPWTRHVSLVHAFARTHSEAFVYEAMPFLRDMTFKDEIWYDRKRPYFASDYICRNLNNQSHQSFETEDAFNSLLGYTVPKRLFNERIFDATCPHILDPCSQRLAQKQEELYLWCRIFAPCKGGVNQYMSKLRALTAKGELKDAAKLMQAFHDRSFTKFEEVQDHLFTAESKYHHVLKKYRQDRALPLDSSSTCR